MAVWRERTLALTFVLLAASVVLILPGLVGVGASGPLLGVVLALGAVLAALRPRLGSLPTVLGYDIRPCARELWLGPVVAVAAVAVVDTGVSAGELQSLGGLLGLLGMLNYFLRPVYLLLYDLLRRLVRSARSSEAR